MCVNHSNATYPALRMWTSTDDLITDNRGNLILVIYKPICARLTYIMTYLKATTHCISKITALLSNRKKKMKLQIPSIASISATLAAAASSIDQIPVPVLVPGSVVSYNFSTNITTHFTALGNADNQTERSLLSETCILTDWGFSCR